MGHPDEESLALSSLDDYIDKGGAFDFSTDNFTNETAEVVADVDASSNGEKLTSALLLMSYDGRHFTGWSAGNDKPSSEHLFFGAGAASQRIMEGYVVDSSLPFNQRNRRRKNSVNGGFVRSIQGVLQTNLAKIYGNIDPDRVVVEGSSRTDKGVHAVGMVAQIYCLTEVAYEAYLLEKLTASSYHEDVEGGQPSIPGKRLPHPWNATDNSFYFEPVPKPLSELAFALNRMCRDISVMAVAPVPRTAITACTTTGKLRPFHPTLSARSKTYQYKFSVGPRHDPIQRRTTWHIATSTPVGTAAQNMSCWDSSLVQQACDCLKGHHNFSAFQGAPRGAGDKRKRPQQDTMCTIESITVTRQASWWDETTATFVVQINGDRFLYKMVRFLVGALVAVGKGKLHVVQLNRFLETGRRNGTEFECAPAHGLVLHQVHYDLPIDWKPARS